MPSAPTTTISGALIIVTWTAPYNGATAITAYTVTIRQSDGVTYTADNTNCNGATPSIVSARSCTIPVATLTAAPFNLPWGASIYAKVSATNVIGTSAASTSGNGAVMLTSPDAPINLVNVPAITSASQIGLAWEDGVNNGGAAVLDYTLSWDQGTSTWTTLTSGVSIKSYKVTGLTQSLNY